MNATTETLINEIYPALFNVLPQALPEFDFRRTGKGWQSSNTLKINGEQGDSKGRVYVYEGSPGYLKDWRVGRMSLWDYIQDREGLTEPKSIIRRLAELAEVSLPEQQFTPDQIERYQEAHRIGEAWEATNDFFIDCLSNGANSHATTMMASRVREYLQNPIDKGGRGYSPSVLLLPNQTQDRESPKMELGYMPGLGPLSNYLEGQGFVGKERDEVVNSIIKAGASVGTQNVLSFPYRDHTGRIRGMAFRTIINNGDYKYLYSEFAKGERAAILFNLKAVAKDKDLVVVESPLEAMHAAALGIKNITALGSSGSSLNKAQVDLALKFGAEKLTLMLDNPEIDKAGALGTDQAIAFLRREYPNLPVYVGYYPEGIKDLDELFAKEGIEGYHRMKGSALAAWRYQLDRLMLSYATAANGQYLEDKQVDDLLTDVVSLSVSLSAIQKDTFIKAFTDDLGVKDLGITPKSISETEAKIRRADFEKEQANDLKKLLREASEAQDTNKALDILSTKARSIKAKDKADSFAALTRVTSEQQMMARIAERPQTLESGYTISGNPLLISAAAITILAGATSHGKSILIANMALNMAELYPDKTFHIFSYEIDEDAYLINLLNTYIGDNQLNRFNNRESIEHYFRGKKKITRKGKFGEPDYSVNLFELGKEVLFDTKRTQFFRELIDAGRLKVHYITYNSDELNEAIRYLKSAEDVGAVFVDYIQLINLPVGKVKTSSRQEEIKQMCIDFNQTATDTGLPLIFGAQFNREVGNIAQMHASKLGEAGDLERIANQIIGIWNCAKKFHGTPSKSESKYIEERIATDENGNPANKDTWYVEALKARVGKPDQWDIWDYFSNAAKVTSNQ